MQIKSFQSSLKQKRTMSTVKINLKIMDQENPIQFDTIQDFALF